MRKSSRIAFIDSGVGGLPYVSQTLDILPDASVFCLADTGNFPYGEKSRDEVISLSLAAMEKVINAVKPGIFVIACNTISTAVLEEARNRFDIPIVGTVPAVKPAAERTKTGVIGILATNRTVNDPYLDSLISQFAPGIKVLKRGAPELVEYVEMESIDPVPGRLESLAAPSLDFFRSGGADVLVLACTHFLHISNELAILAGPDVSVIDSSNGVARRVKTLAMDMGLNWNKDPERDFFISGKDPGDSRYKRFARKFRLEYRGQFA